MGEVCLWFVAVVWYMHGEMVTVEFVGERKQGRFETYVRRND